MLVSDRYDASAGSLSGNGERRREPLRRNGCNRRVTSGFFEKPFEVGLRNRERLLLSYVRKCQRRRRDHLLTAHVHAYRSSRALGDPKIVIGTENHPPSARVSARNRRDNRRPVGREDNVPEFVANDVPRLTARARCHGSAPLPPTDWHVGDRA